MKRASKLTLATLVALNLAVVGPSRAAEPPLPDGGEGHPPGPPPFGGRHFESMEKKLQEMHSSLKLDAGQEKAWSDWMAKIKENRMDWQEKRKQFESWENLPAIERMEKHLAFARQRLSREEEKLAATKTFYAVLSPDQKQIFDKEFKLWPHGMGRHRQDKGPPPNPK